MPMVEQIHTRHGVSPAEYPVDGGFARHADPEAAAGCGVAVSAPVPRPKDASQDRHPRLPGDRPVIAAWRERTGTAAAKAKAVYKEQASTIK